MGSRGDGDSIRDRDKKSFSEIDKARRERRYGRDDDSPRQKRIESSQAYSNYKRQLDRAFDGGGLPDALKAKLDETDFGKTKKARKAAAKVITDASTPKQIFTAFVAYKEAHGFPEEEEVLGKLLQLDDEPEVVSEALRIIGKLAAAGTLKRGKSLKARVKTAKMTTDDDDVFAAAKELLGHL